MRVYQFHHIRVYKLLTIVYSRLGHYLLPDMELVDSLLIFFGAASQQPTTSAYV